MVKSCISNIRFFHTDGFVKITYLYRNTPTRIYCLLTPCTNLKRWYVSMVCANKQEQEEIIICKTYIHFTIIYYICLSRPIQRGSECKLLDTHPAGKRSNLNKALVIVNVGTTARGVLFETAPISCKWKLNYCKLAQHFF